MIRADEFGDQVSAKLSATPNGVTEVFHLFKIFEERRKRAAKGKAKDTHPANPTEEIEDMPLTDQDMAVPEQAVDKDEAADIKRTILYALNEVADLHERVRKCVPSP